MKPAGVKIPPASPAGRKISFNLESPEKQPRTPTLASPGGRRMSGTPTSPDKLMALHKAPLAKGKGMQRVVQWYREAILEWLCSICMGYHWRRKMVWVRGATIGVRGQLYLDSQKNK